MRDWITNCFPAVALAIGIVMGGWFIGGGLIYARLGDRFVTVKGLAERSVKAGLFVWPIRFIVTGNDLSQVQNQITKDADMIRGLMGTAGIPFIIAQTLVIRSEM